MYKKIDLSSLYEIFAKSFLRASKAPIETLRVYPGQHLIFGNMINSIGKVRSDQAKEHVALERNLGGVHKSYSKPYKPDLIDIAERINRTIMEGIHSILI